MRTSDSLTASHQAPTTSARSPTAADRPRVEPSGRPLGGSPADEHVHDVVIVGAGPSGSACAYWLAEAGWDVVVVEKKQFPRDKTCGDGLTPRAVRQLVDMGLSDALAGAHRFGGLRAFGFGQMIEMQWPEHPAFPSYGYTITRHDLDELVADRAAKAGAGVLQGHEALAPLDPVEAESPLPTGAARPPRTERAPTWTRDTLASCAGVVVRNRQSGTTRTLRARYVVMADGANRGSDGLLGPAGTGATRLGWRCVATIARRATTTRSSSRTSTSAVPTVT